MLHGLGGLRLLVRLSKSPNFYSFDFVKYIDIGEIKKGRRGERIRKSINQQKQVLPINQSKERRAREGRVSGVIERERTLMI